LKWGQVKTARAFRQHDDSRPQVSAFDTSARRLSEGLLSTGRGAREGGNGGRGCVLSDGCFAFFGGIDASGTTSSSCEALTLDVDG